MVRVGVLARLPSAGSREERKHLPQSGKRNREERLLLRTSFEAADTVSLSYSITYHPAKRVRWCGIHIERVHRAGRDGGRRCCRLRSMGKMSFNERACDFNFG